MLSISASLFVSPANSADKSIMTKNVWPRWSSANTLNLNADDSTPTRTIDSRTTWNNNSRLALRSERRCSRRCDELPVVGCKVGTAAAPVLPLDENGRVASASVVWTPVCVDTVDRAAGFAENQLRNPIALPYEFIFDLQRIGRSLDTYGNLMRRCDTMPRTQQVTNYFRF